MEFRDAVNHLSSSSAVAAAGQPPHPAVWSSHRPTVAQVHSLSTEQQTIHNVEHMLTVFSNCTCTIINSPSLKIIKLIQYLLIISS